MRSRALTLGLAAAAIAAGAWIVSQARFVADLSMFLPEAPTEEQRLLVDQLRDGAITRMVFIGIEDAGAGQAALAAISRDMRRRLEASGEFVSVANGAATGFERERDLILAHRYVLSPRVKPERFTVEGLREAVGETVDLLASPAGMLVKSIVTRDPTAETLAIVEALRPEGGPGTREGVWFSSDGKRALLLARTRAAGSDTDAQARALSAVQRAYDEAAAQAKARANLVVTGPSVFAAKSRELVRHDVERLATWSLALIVGLLLAAYRSPLALVLGLVPVACGALAGVVAVSLGFGAVHGITLGFGTALIGEAIDYSIYLFVQSEGREVGGPDWVRRFWPTIRLGVLTSIAGFVALLFSGLPGLAQLGLYAIVGVVTASLATRYFLPALLPRGFAVRDLSGAGRVLLRVVATLGHVRLAVPLAALAAAAVLLTHGPLWDPDLASLNPVPRWDRENDARMRADLGASDARVVVAVHAASADAALAAAERVGERLDALVARHVLGGYESPARVLPSLATQHARRESLPPPEVLRERLGQALAQSPLRAERLGPFLEEAAKARTEAPLTRETLAGTAMEAAIDGLLFADARGRWTAIVGLRAPEGGLLDANAVRTALVGTQALVLDLKAELDRLYSGYFDRALAMSALGLVAIVALVAFALRDRRRVLRVLAPLAAAVLVAAAVQVLAGSRLTLLHLVGLLLVVAIGSNYALFFDRLGEGDAGSARTLASLTLANVTTVASFGVLALSAIPVLHAIGATVAAGAVAALLFAAMLARGGGRIAP